MAIHVEYELRCDCRGEKDPFGCEPALYGTTPARVIAAARSAGWVVRRSLAGDHRYFKPGHEEQA